MQNIITILSLATKIKIKQFAHLYISNVLVDSITNPGTGWLSEMCTRLLIYVTQALNYYVLCFQSYVRGMFLISKVMWEVCFSFPKLCERYVSCFQSYVRDVSHFQSYARDVSCFQSYVRDMFLVSKVMQEICLFPKLCEICFLLRKLCDRYVSCFQRIQLDLSTT